MSKCSVPILFIHFYLLINLPMVILSNEPDSKCHELIGSSRFGEMIKQLKGKIPIKNSTYQDAKIWNEGGAVKYSVLLLAMKGFIAEVKYLSQNLHHYKDFVYILEQKCGTKFVIVSVTCEEVVNEALECAIAIHKFIVQQNDPETSEKRTNLGTTDLKTQLLNKAEKWSTVDTEFETALKTIWVYYEPVAEYYVYCHEMTKWMKFKDMIGKLKNKIPIKGHLMNYDQVLLAIERFLTEMEDVKKYTKWALDNGYAVSTDIHSKAMDVDVHVKGQNNYLRLLVGSALDDAMKCANIVRKFTQNLKILKIGGYEQEPQYNWTEMDVKFEEELQKLLKTEYADKLAAAEGVDSAKKKGKTPVVAKDTDAKFKHRG